MVKYCDTLESKDKRNREYKGYLNEETILCLLDEITEETDDGDVELNGLVFSSMTKQQRQQAADDAKLVKAVIIHCIDNWDNEFMRQLYHDLVFHADNQK